jgi:hypothetical protein
MGRPPRQIFAAKGVRLVGATVLYSAQLFVVELVGISPVAESVCGFCLGAIVNDPLKYNFTFLIMQTHRVAVPKFVTLLEVEYCIYALVMMAGMLWTSLRFVIVHVLARAPYWFGALSPWPWAYRIRCHGHE